MSGAAKAAVMIYLTKELRRMPKQRVLYESKMVVDFVCTVRVEGVERWYDGIGFGASKKKSEHAAYEGILCDMILDGHIIDGCDAILNVSTDPKAGSARSKLYRDRAVAARLAPYVSRAVGTLRKSRHKTDYLNHLNNFASAVGVTMTLETNQDPRRGSMYWSAIARIVLPDASELVSIYYYDYTRSASSNNSAKDLIEQILKHYEQ
ncbi:TPA: hypothetical protein DDX46_02505 [Candidatus Saccharibacteria bacterium]|nr:MAG: hypothetical protein UW38_C0001G0321 [Candidatus Saccharibacteria bacterium GW2011_GWC2_44_17]OGL33202.1 MAG: hypothetical protein A3E20_01170 [Candidatus Saccharibacteria bacterium RIFCSPHIGHO2_12_FULL_47_16]HBH77598.1 hypothetical protein [Candidatus Saccharibacteria bacterium]